MSSYRLGVDIGGTFTDGVVVREQDGAVTITKVLTTPDDQARGFLEALGRLAEETGLAPEELRSILHATTAATNAVLERRGAAVGLITTRGFRDVQEIARQIRHELYNLQTDKPAPLVPRRLCLEVTERLNYLGEVLEPLDEADVLAAIEQFRAEGITSIAVCLLHSYRNPQHEQRIGALLREHYPEAVVSLSSDIAPEIREYWRTSTTVVNAYVAPIVRRYLDNLEQRLRASNYGAPVLIMQSSGGVVGAAAARERPVAMLESGPAAGVASAAYFANLAGFPNAISFDMGGTTAKAGLVLNGRPSVLPEFEAGSRHGTGAGVVRGSGYPILTPVVDLVEISSGGGSQAWVDAGGLLRVGPHSAGADPGPACYGRGGELPTVTDANLMLGRLNADNFLGGRMRLDTEAAKTAISKVAEQLGLDVMRTAAGIVTIADTAMMQAIRLITVQRGYDPRTFALVAFGGAGPLHAVTLANELGVEAVIVPPSPGVASAMGLLLSDLRFDVAGTVLRPLSEVTPDEINAMLADLEREALAALEREGVPAEYRALERQAELRYVGQSWRLPTDLPNAALTADDLPAIKAGFDAVHAQRYGYSVPEEPAELVSLRVIGIGRLPRPQFREPPQGGADSSAARTGTRSVHFGDAGGLQEAGVYNRYALHLGNLVPGPAVVEEMDSSTVIAPGYTAEVITAGVLMIKRNGAA